MEVLPHPVSAAIEQYCLSLFWSCSMMVCSADNHRPSLSLPARLLAGASAPLITPPLTGRRAAKGRNEEAGNGGIEGWGRYTGHSSPQHVSIFPPSLFFPLSLFHTHSLSTHTHTQRQPTVIHKL